jgi:hypothetical protein
MGDTVSERLNKAFYVDGSLRDIYVLGTTEQDWQKLLMFLHAGPYSVTFIIAGEQRPLLAQIEEVFSLIHSSGGMMRIDEDCLALHCFFYTVDEIEFDLDPRTINTEERLSRLLDFMRAIGNLLNKSIILSPENASSVALFRFDPVTKSEEWLSE